MILHDAGVGLHFGVDQTLAHLGRHLCRSLVGLFGTIYKVYTLLGHLEGEEGSI